jgi:hypothetical protein
VGRPAGDEERGDRRADGEASSHGLQYPSERPDVLAAKRIVDYIFRCIGKTCGHLWLSREHEVLRARATPGERLHLRSLGQR